MHILEELPHSQPMPELFAVLTIDGHGNEGILTLDDLPLVWGSIDNTELILKMLPDIAKKFKSKIVLARFSQKEIIKEYK